MIPIALKVWLESSRSYSFTLKYPSAGGLILQFRTLGPFGLNPSLLGKFFPRSVQGLHTLLFPELNFKRPCRLVKQISHLDRFVKIPVYGQIVPAAVREGSAANIW